MVTSFTLHDQQATDAAFVNDTYYFYLSVGPGTIGVVTADHYTGPWTDPLGKPLLDHTSEPGATFRDPCVFEEDDGSHYIIAGPLPSRPSVHYDSSL